MAHATLAAHSGTVTIRLEGTVTPHAAVKTFTRAAELACEHVVIDLSRATDIPEVALAFLAGGLVALRWSRVSLVGVPAEHEDVLARLGVQSLLRQQVTA